MMTYQRPTFWRTGMQMLWNGCGSMKIPRNERAHEVELMPTQLDSPRYHLHDLVILWLVGERLMWKIVFRIMIRSLLRPS